jgi:hypothetical protein
MQGKPERSRVWADLATTQPSDGAQPCEDWLDNVWQRDTDISGVLINAKFEEFRHNNVLTAGSFIAKGRPPRVPEDVSCDDVVLGFRSHASPP